jgi:hypothetical protein
MKRRQMFRMAVTHIMVGTGIGSDVFSPKDHTQSGPSSQNHPDASSRGQGGVAEGGAKDAGEPDDDSDWQLVRNRLSSVAIDDRSSRFKTIDPLDALLEYILEVRL